MSPREIYYTAHFAKKFKKLPAKIKKQAITKERAFRKDPFDPKLKTHKLTGKLKDYFAFSLNRSYRILFAFEKSGAITFIDVGTHAIYAQ